jgi:hypothetical protein
MNDTRFSSRNTEPTANPSPRHGQCMYFLFDGLNIRHDIEYFYSWESQIVQQDTEPLPLPESPSSFLDDDDLARHDGLEGEPQYHHEPADARLLMAYRSGDAERLSRASSSVPDDGRLHRAASAASYGTGRGRSPAARTASSSQPRAPDGAREWSRPPRSLSRSSQSSSPPSFANHYANNAHVDAYRVPSAAPASSSWHASQPLTMPFTTHLPPPWQSERDHHLPGALTLPPPASSY